MKPKCGNDSFCFFFINGHNLKKIITIFFFFFSINIIIEMFHQTSTSFILNGIKMKKVSRNDSSILLGTQRRDDGKNISELSAMQHCWSRNYDVINLV